MRKLLLFPLLIAALGLNTAHAERAIENIAGDVYRFQNKFHYSVFVVTGDGVIVTDPINAEAANWLKTEIGKLTDQPITHLIYSHSDGDHASGGAAFGEVPTVITHTNAPDAIDGVIPTRRFNDEMTLSHGGKRIELTYLGPGHGKDLIAMVIRPENVGFVVDAVSAKRLPYRNFPGANADEWADQVSKADALEFEILAGGHGPLGTKADVTSAKQYLQELRAEVLEGLKAGQSVDELKQSIGMEKYRDWGSYDQWLALNIQGMARSLVENGTVMP